jgi:hypothetical protein
MEALGGMMYQLRKTTLSVDVGSTKAVMIPEGEVITVGERTPLDHRMITVEWRGRTLMIFRQDLRGKRVEES